MESRLSIPGFREICRADQQELNGGFWPLVSGLILVAAAQIVKDWDNFKNGLKGTPEE
jgi:hypothetical protein